MIGIFIKKIECEIQSILDFFTFGFSVVFGFKIISLGISSVFGFNFFLITVCGTGSSVSSSETDF